MRRQQSSRPTTRPAIADPAEIGFTTLAEATWHPTSLTW